MRPKLHPFSAADTGLSVTLVLLYLGIIVSPVFSRHSNPSGDISDSEKIAYDIIINEDSRTGEYQIYAIGRDGLKGITPEAVIDDDEYQGSCRVYHVSYPEMNELISAHPAASSSDGIVPIYSLIELGLGDIRPSIIIERDDGAEGIRVYRVDDLGHKKPRPVEVIKKEGNGYSVYAVDENGKLATEPVRTVQTTGEPEARGVLLLPSITRITHDPANATIQTVRKVGEMPDSLVDKQAWRSSRSATKAEKE